MGNVMKIPARPQVGSRTAKKRNQKAESSSLLPCFN